ncbi:unnamed protein product [Calypogeia fissa]
MALIISSTSAIAETSENAVQPAPSHNGLTSKGTLPLFKPLSEDILVNIFSRLEQDPQHLARLACVCKTFAHVVRNVCWKRQCTRIVPEIMPSPQTHLDQIPEPPGGWGALMKLLVCCPGLKHAGVATPCWDFGLEREIGPMEMYNIQPRYVPKRRIAADNVQVPEGGELTTSRDASVSGDLPVRSYTLSVRDSSVQSYTISRRDCSVGSNLKSGTGSGQAGEKSAIKVENGNSNGNGGIGQSFETDSAATTGVVVQERGSGNGHGNGNGQSTEKDSSAPMDVSVEGDGNSKRNNRQRFEKDSPAPMDGLVQETGSIHLASNGDPDLRHTCLTEAVGQDLDENSLLMTEESSRSLLPKNSPSEVEIVGQGTLNGELSAASAPVNQLPQSSTELSNAPVAMNQDFPAGCDDVAMSTTTAENNGGSASIDHSSTVEVRCGSGRPPRWEPVRPVERVHWKEEELASKGDKVVGSKSRSPVEHVTNEDRGRSRRKRKERELKLLLAKVPEDPKQRLHMVPAKWTLPREEGSRLLASRFRCDSLYICDWPGCVHAGEKRNYKLFRGFFKNFRTSLLWRNLKDVNARKLNIACAFCSSSSTWDMMTAFCLRRSFQYHDDGEPVVQACVCENGHVSGAWTDRPGFFAAH